MRFLTLLSLLVYSSLSLALGLGDIELKSHLGEKLFAKVIITDIDAQSESSCFSVGDIGDTPAFKKATASIQPSNSGYLLSITTSEIVTEPIVNLRVSFNCEPNVNREYVLLLDPAPIPALEKVASEDKTNAQTVNLDTDKKKSRQTSRKKPPLTDTISQSANDPTSDIPVLKKPSKKKKRTVVSSVDDKLNEAYTGKLSTGITSSTTSENIAAPVNTPSTSDKPFLVISGDPANTSDSATKPGLSLRFATEIDFARPAPVITSPNSTDTMDEVTVMANRLAHLEKQITTLQIRNTKLLADAAKAKEESDAVNWQKILLFALGIIATLAITERLRRKFFAKQSNNESAEWFDAETGTNDTEETTSPPSISFERNRANEPSFSEAHTNQSADQDSDASSIKTLMPIENEGHESVVDDANVFIEHGRPTLAIQLLQNHLIEAPAESPAIWFKLLNLLAKEGSETDYDEAVVECNKYFNIKAAKFGDTSSIDNSSIEDYPHIVSRLEGVWGSQYAVAFLNDVIYNKRSQPREGLEQGAFDDLFFLKTIARHLDTSSPSTRPNNFHQTISAKPDFENVSFNDALFTDIEPLVDTTLDMPSATNAVDDLNNQASFNADASLYDSDPSYEVSMLINAEPTTTVDNSIETIDFSLTQHNSEASGINQSFQAEEINFTAPTEEIEIVSTPTAPMLNIETPENAIPALPHQDKTESNQIEWDLPEISSKIEVKTNPKKISKKNLKPNQ
ncbi:MAG: hypothetical protein Q8M99_09710 [Methylotenera sp.]|nr:hypothetical protein [Methylotenera sp.]